MTQPLKPQQIVNQANDPGVTSYDNNLQDVTRLGTNTEIFITENYYTNTYKTSVSTFISDSTAIAGGVPASSTAPQQPNVGSVYFNTTSNQLFVYNGAAWIAAGQVTDAANVYFAPTANIFSSNVQAAIEEVQANALQIGGGTLTGPLILSGAPTSALMAVTKDYVDTELAFAQDQPFTPSGNITAVTIRSAINELDINKLAISGGTLTGSLILAADPTLPLEAASKQYVDNAIANTYTAGTGINITGNIIRITDTGVTTGTYGNSSQSASFTVDAQGRLTAASQSAITANAALLTGPTLSPAVVNSSLTSVGALNNLVVNGNIDTLTLRATGNVSGGNVTTTGQMVAAGNITGGNLTTGGQVIATGNVVSSANLIGNNVNATNAITAGTTVSAVGNITGGNVVSNGALTATGNITGGNIVSSGDISALGNIITGNIVTTGNISTTGNFNAGNFVATGQVVAGGNIVSSANLIGNNVNATNAITAGTTVTAVGNIAGGNLTTTGQVNAQGNITGGNVASAGNVTAAGNVDGANINGGNLSATNNIVAGGAITVGGNLTAGNIATSGAFSAAGNVSGGNLTTGGQVVATGNVVSSANINGNNLNASNNITAVGSIAAGGNVAGGNLTTPGQVVAAGNIVTTANVNGNNLNASNAITAGTTITAVGNVSGGNLTTGGQVVATGNIVSSANIDGNNLNATNAITAGTTITAVGNVSGGNLTTGGQVVATGNIVSSANINGNNLNAANAITAGTTITAVGNVSGGNLTTGGQVVATGNIVSSANIDGNNLNASNNITAGGNLSVVGNISGGNATITGNLTAGNIIGNFSGNFSAPGANTQVIYNNAGILGADSGMTFDYLTDLLTVTGNISGGNLVTVGIVSATGNVDGGNITTVGQVVATANVAGGNLTTGGQVVATGNVSGGNLTTAGQVVTSIATGTAPLIVTSTTRVANLNVDYANVSDNSNIADATTGNHFIMLSATATGNVPLKSNANIYANLSTGVLYANGFSGNISGNITAPGANTQVIYNNAGVLTADSGMTFDYLTDILTVVGNVTGGNLTTAGVVSATGNVDGGNITTAGQVVATGNLVSSANVNAANLNTTGNVTAVGTMTATGNITGGNIGTGGQVVATGNVTGGNLTTAGNTVAAGNIQANVGFIGNSLTTRDGPMTITSSGSNNITLATGTGNINLAPQTFITNVKDPVNAQDAATKAYVDALAQGLKPKASVQAATTGAITLSGTQTVDGVALAAGDRVLVKDQANAADNGIYVCDAGTWPRATDYDTAALAADGSFVFVDPGGTTNGSSAFVQISTVVTLGVDPIVYAQFSSGGSYTAGVGLSLTGSQFNLQNTSVAAGSYGNATHVASFTVDAQGRLTAAANVQIAGTAGGTNTQVQYNNAGALAGNSTFTFDQTTGMVTVANLTATTNVTATDKVFVGNTVETIATGAYSHNYSNGEIKGNWILSASSSLQATYADLAEVYASDQDYTPGTVLEFGGSSEVTLATPDTTRIAGVVTTNPAYVMNQACQGDHTATIALVGRTPCRVVGRIQRGDLLCSAGNGHAMTAHHPKLGGILGRALENHNSDGHGVIEIVIGKS